MKKKTENIIIEALLDRFRSLSERSVSKPLKVDKVHVPFSLPRTFNARAKGNLKAIQLLMSKPPSSMTKADRETVRQYTGWGGFKSVVEWNDKIKDPNWIITDDAITYEYYTPYTLTYSIREKILPIIQGKKEGFLSVPKWKKKYLALEGSAGIGRFVDPFYTNNFQWNTIEPAIQSATVLMALYPESKTNITTFDEWAFRNDPVGIYSMVMGNPPYKNRGQELMEDPSWADYKRAEHYQLLRTLPMLNKGGLSVMVIPRSTMSKKDSTNEKVRAEMLKYAHLIGAVRLPTHSLIDGKLKDAVFNNVATPIDVLFLQARGGKLKETKQEDQYIINGDYFKKHPNHIMGVVNEPNTSVTLDGKKFDNKFMFTRIIMKGKFDGLIDFSMRPISESIPKDFSEIIGEGRTSVKKRKAEKVIRKDEDVELDKSIVEMMDEASQQAYHIAPKIQNFIKNVELNTNVSRLEAHAVREGINNELQAFSDKYGNPRARGKLASLKQKDPFRYNIFISVFTEDGNPIGEVAKPLPLRFEYNGDPKDYNTLLSAWYRHAQKYKQFPIIREEDLRKARRTLKIADKTSFVEIAKKLSSQGWCLHPTEKHPVFYILPQDRYYEGDLWPRYDALNDYLEKNGKDKKLQEIYQKQLSQLIDPDPQTQKSLMDLATFPDLLNGRKILPNSPLISESLLNRFFDTLHSIDASVNKGVGKLRKPKIIIKNKKYYIQAKINDLSKTFSKLLESSYSFALIRDGKKKKDDYGGIDILEGIFPSVYKGLKGFFDPRKDTVEWEFFGKVKNIEDFIILDIDDLRPKSGFQSILSPQQQMFYGMLTKDSNIFKPAVASGTKNYSSENGYGAKVRIRRELEDKFIDFLSEIQQKPFWIPLTDKYNRMFKGYVEPNYYQGEDIILNGWKGYGLRPYQAEAVRKMAYQKQGLLAFDVGLGKTLTGIATIALAKQQGWCQRPLIVVPNSILFKWKSDILKAIPDWKIVTIGANQFYDKDGNLKSRTDTAEQRGEKWLQFSLGAYDVALLTYSMLDRTQFREDTYGDFSMKHLDLEENIYAQIAEKRSQKKSEAKLQAKKQQIESQIANMLLPPKSQRIFDKGVTWEDIGIDLMLIDEAQNFKNLFVPKTDFSVAPKFLGASPASKKSYNLDIRCMQVRSVAQRKYGSNNVFLLSATPAKNSPMEFYNLIQYIDPQIFVRYGIRSSSDFYDRFIGIEHGIFYNSKLEVQEYPQVRSFINLDDFRMILNRYCTFEVFETIIKRYPEIEKSIKVPSVNNKLVRMKLDSEQNELIEDIQRRMGKVDIDEDGNIIEQDPIDDEDKISPLEGIVLSQLICIHPILIEDRFKVYDEEEDIPDDPELKKKKKKKSKRLPIPQIEKVLKTINIHSPKLDAVTQNIARLRKDPSRIMGDITCGNIIFIQNIVVQFMIRDLLIQAGIPKWSIGIMNATLLKDPQSRQNTAESFNFISEFYVIGDKALNEVEYQKLSSSKQKKAQKINGYRYDIIIANSIAYEGIDLQHRTCAIHHVDLAWEPATITQRNGRGVRSGNEYKDVEVYYYIMENSVDQYMYLTIQGKRGWLVSAIESQDREINNLGASETSAEAMLQLTATSQEDFERRKAIAKRIALEKKIENQKKLIFSQIKKTGILFTQARTSNDPRIKDNAEKALEALKMKDVSIYPYLSYVDELRNTRPVTFKSNMYDIAFIKGMFYIVGGNRLAMFVKEDKSQNIYKFLIMGNDSIREVVTDTVYDAFSYPKNLVVPFFYSHTQRTLSDCPSLVGDHSQEQFALSAYQYIYGKDSELDTSSTWRIAVDKPSHSPSVIQERMDTFYRFLIQEDYISLIDKNSEAGERAKNKLYIALVKDKDFTIRKLHSLPLAYREEMYNQGFMDFLLRARTIFRENLIVKNTIDNTIWVLDDSKGILFDAKLQKVDKDGFQFHVPKRDKFKKISPKITLENVEDYVTPITFGIFIALKMILKTHATANTFNIVAMFKDEEFISMMGDSFKRLREAVLYQRLKDIYNDINPRSEIIKTVLGFNLTGLLDGGYVSLNKSKTMTLPSIQVNLVPFEPNKAGFRELKKMIDSGRKIHFLSNYKILNPYLLQKIKGSSESIDSIISNKELSGRFNLRNEKYFGIGRRNKVKYTEILSK